MSKLFNSLALVASLTISTAIYAMEREENPKLMVTKKSSVVNEALMEEARRITREKVLKNLYNYSKHYFNENSEMVYQIQSFFVKANKVQYERNIYWFNENFLSNPSQERALNNTILAFLKDGTKPIYCEYEDAFYGVAQALNAAGITLDTLVGKTADAEEVMEEESKTSEALEENTPPKRRRCAIS